MADPLEQVLRLVAEGRLTAEEAAPLLDALDTRGSAAAQASATAGAPARQPSAGEPPDAGRPRFALIEVTEGGRREINLRVPLSLGRSALNAIPGLSNEYLAQVREALTKGVTGPILDVRDEDGDGVLIVIE